MAHGVTLWLRSLACHIDFSDICDLPNDVAQSDGASHCAANYKICPIFSIHSDGNQREIIHVQA